MIIRLVLILSALWAIPALADSRPTTTARGAATRPTAAIEPADCVTSECHAGIKAGAVVHGPVATNACDSCHELTSTQRHTFTVRREKADLCTYCHEFSVAGMSTVHKPVAEGQCLGCHDPHSGATKALTREATTPELCGRCHENVVADKSFVHSPVAKGACDSCHPPHASKFPKLLDAVGSDLCLACHTEFEPAISHAKFKHKALEKGCPECHSAHGSNAPAALAKPVPDLCLGCHDKLKDKIASAAVPHSAVTRDRTCMNCHTSHASNVGKLLTEVPSTGCLHCHDKAVKTQRGYTVAAVKEVADSKLVKHGELKDGQCGGCHDVHGGQRAALLTKPYSPTFYQSFSADNYAFCFACHDSQLAQVQKTTKATNFRNGDVNLHFVHATSGTRDKNCRACHATHAAANSHIIRTSLQYGKWDMPIAYADTATGGSCAPGCHDQYSYDREHPVRNAPATSPSSKPTTRPGSEGEYAKLISWSATDVLGKPVTVPQDRKATALVLVSSDDASAKDLLDRLRALESTKAVQMLVVVSGTGAEAISAELAKATAWSVIADANHDAAEALGIHGWPIIVVLRPDGMEVARVSGEPTFLAIRLPAYLQLAAGQIDQKTLQERLASQPVVLTDDAKRQARDLRTARILLDENKPQQAITFLDRDAKTTAKLPEARALRAEALLQLGKPDETLDILDQIPAGAVPANTVDLLSARAYVAQERWALAKSIMEKSLERDSNQPQAHRLMGQIYEQEQNYPKAAEQYRMATEKSR